MADRFLGLTLRLLATAALAAGVACAQALLDTPKKIADAGKILDTARGRAANCAIFPMEPRFNFTLRLQAGYMGEVRLQPDQVGRKWVVLMRITPLEGDRRPVYLSDVVQLPEGAKRTPAQAEGPIRAEVSGAFWVGEGRYAVKWLMFDRSGDVCRKEWQIDARLRAGERTVNPLLAPDTVAGVRWAGGARAEGSAPGIGRLTILLDAASMQQGKAMGTAGKGVLLDALLALVDEMPARGVRLVIFSLDHQKEVWRKEGFTARALPEAAKALEEMPWAVDYHLLQNQGGRVDLIESLVSSEIHAAEPADAVVLLGPHSLYGDKPTLGFERPAGAKPQFFYVMWANVGVRRRMAVGAAASMAGGGGPGGGWIARSDPVMGSAADPENGGMAVYAMEGSGRNAGGRAVNVRPNFGPDSIQYAVKQLGGKVLKVDSPDSFAKAVAEIRSGLGATR